MIDVAVTPFDMPPAFDCAYFPAEKFIDEKTRKRVQNIGIGTIAHIVGLFRLHAETPVICL